VGRLFGREVRQWTAEPPVPPFPGTNVFGQPSLASNPEAALQVPTVWACVKLLADTVSSMPLETFRKTGAGVPQRITDPTVVATPDASETQSEWIHSLMVSLLLRGNAYCLITSRDQLARPTQLITLNPDMVRVQQDPQSGAVVYKLGSSQQDRTRDIWHVRGLTLPGRKLGLSPIAYAAATLGVDISARKFASDFYSGGGVPKGKLKSDQAINQEQATTLKERLRAATLNREPVALGSGVDYELLPVKAEESQFLKTQQFNIAQIARFFSVPAEMVGGSTGSSLTYTTGELNSLNFLTYGVQFWLKRIEDSFFPIMPQPQYVRFNTSMLLRTDALNQAKIDAIDVAAKIRPPSEIRHARDLPPLTDEQKTELSLVPLAVTPNEGSPKSLPQPPTPATYADAPNESPKPKLGVVNG
jgi:HK97 family phage portal protein